MASLKGTARRLQLLFLAGFASLGAGLYLYATYIGPVRDMVEAQGEITGVKRETVKRGDQWVTQFAPIIRFTAEDGRLVEAAPAATAAEPAKAGTKLAIRYDPKDPGRIALSRNYAVSPAVPALFGAFGVILLIAGTYVMSRLRKQARIPARPRGPLPPRGKR